MISFEELVEKRVGFSRSQEFLGTSREMADAMDIEAGNTSPDGVDEQDFLVAGHLAPCEALSANRVAESCMYVAGAEQHGLSSTNAARAGNIEPPSTPIPPESGADSAGPPSSEGG